MGAARRVRQDLRRHRKLPGHERHGLWRSAGEIVRHKTHEAQCAQFEGKSETRVWPSVDGNLLLILHGEGKERDQVLIGDGERETVSAVALGG